MMALTAFEADAIGVASSAAMAAWVVHWERRERHIQRVLKTIEIRFHAVHERHREAPGWFEWRPVQAPKQPTVTEMHEQWLAALTEEDRHNMAALGRYWDTSKLVEQEEVAA